MGTWDEDTRPQGLLRPSLQQRAAESVPPDDDSTLGMLMRQTVQNTAAIQAMKADMTTLVREWRVHQKGIDEDRPVLASDSAKHASNRIAVLMGSLFTLYEVTAPYLREVFRQVFHR